MTLYTKGRREVVVSLGAGVWPLLADPGGKMGGVERMPSSGVLAQQGCCGERSGLGNNMVRGGKARVSGPGVTHSKPN